MKGTLVYRKEKPYVRVYNVGNYYRAIVGKDLDRYILERLTESDKDLLISNLHLSEEYQDGMLDVLEETNLIRKAWSPTITRLDMESDWIKEESAKGAENFGFLDLDDGSIFYGGLSKEKNILSLAHEWGHKQSGHHKPGRRVKHYLPDEKEAWEIAIKNIKKSGELTPNMVDLASKSLATYYSSTVPKKEAYRRARLFIEGIE